MADGNAKFTTQEVTRDGIRYRQILNGNTVVGEEELGEVKAKKPNTPPSEPASAAAPETAKTEPAVQPAQPEEKKGLTAKMKKGLAIGGGVLAGVAAYALGVKRGKDEGTATGYEEGYRDGKYSAESASEANDWEAQE